jgi:hypothetical protein
VGCNALGLMFTADIALAIGLDDTSVLVLFATSVEFPLSALQIKKKKKKCVGCVGECVSECVSE